jgi:hypothetical protein
MEGRVTIIMVIRVLFYCFEPGDRKAELGSTAGHSRHYIKTTSAGRSLDVKFCKLRLLANPEIASVYDTNVILSMHSIFQHHQNGSEG